MVLLWQLFPNHPNLLPTYFDPKYLGDDYIAKPIDGRLGENITLHTQQEIIRTDGHYGQSEKIYQKAHPLPSFQGNYPVIGSWLIASEPSGIGIREDNSLITQDHLCRFVPHLIS